MRCAARRLGVAHEPLRASVATRPSVAAVHLQRLRRSVDRSKPATANVGSLSDQITPF